MYQILYKFVPLGNEGKGSAVEQRVPLLPMRRVLNGSWQHFNSRHHRSRIDLCIGADHSAHVNNFFSPGVAQMLLKAIWWQSTASQFQGSPTETMQPRSFPESSLLMANSQDGTTRSGTRRSSAPKTGSRHLVQRSLHDHLEA